MRRVSFTFAILLSIAGSAAAQNVEPPRWDINASAGFFQGRPTDDTRGWDDWYGEGRYAVALGRYWSTHFKTEIEFATTGEGRRFTQHYVPVPGTVINQPVRVDQFLVLRQTSARAVWQFSDNAWVHPYLNAGVVFDVERTRQFVPEQFYFPPGSPRTPIDLGVANETTSGQRVGFTVGGGAKFYFTPSAYVNTGMQVSRAKPSTTISFVAGFGIDF